MKNKINAVLSSFLILAVVAPKLSLADACDTIKAQRVEKLRAAHKFALQRKIVEQTREAIERVEGNRTGHILEAVAGFVTLAITYCVTSYNAIESVEGNGFSVLKDALKSSPSFYAFTGAGIYAAADGIIHVRMSNRALKEMRPKLNQQEFALKDKESAYLEIADSLKVALTSMPACQIGEDPSDLIVKIDTSVSVNPQTK
jgi:hypothetical protein